MGWWCKMLYGLYLSAAGLQVQERQQDMIAHHLANGQTNGFKRDLAIVQSRANAVHEDSAMVPYRVPVLEDQGGGVFLRGNGVDLTQSALKTSPNWHDLALEGRGFFVLSGESPTLTRDGGFMVNDQGGLIHAASGRAVLGEDGEPIVLDLALGAVSVDRAGQIVQNDGAVAKLKLVDINDHRQLVKMGQNLLTVRDAGVLVPMGEGTRVLERQLEMSGVNPMVELVNMISGQRTFDANAKMISLQDMTLQSLNSIGRVA